MSESVALLPPLSLDEWRAQGQYFNFNGQCIFYCCAGERSKPALLLVHGFPTASWDWRHIWSALAQDYFVIAADMLGFGFSAKPVKGDYRISVQADLQQALLKHLQVGKHHILAHDYGVTVTQELLERELSATTGILSTTLLNGGLFPETHKPVLLQKLLISPLGFLVARQISEKSFQRTLSRICAKPLTREDQQGFWRLINENNGLAVFHKLIRYMRERSEFRSRWVAALQASEHALCLINGLEDPISGAHMVARYREVVAKEPIIELPGVGHYPQVEAPELVLQAFQSFIANVNSA